MREAASDAQVVGDEDEGQAARRLQLAQQAQDPGARRGIQGGHRLVQDQDAGLDRQRAGDGHALALPARELVRKAFRVAGGQADQLQQLRHAALAPRSLELAVNEERLRDAVGDAAPRVQRRIRILEHDLYPLARGAQRGA